MATTTTPAPLVVLNAAQIRDNYLRRYRNGLIAIGVENPNVSPGSDIYIRGQALGNELEVAMANIQVKADEQMPDTATGDNLVRWAVTLKLPDGQGGYGRRQPQGAAGFVVFSASATSTVGIGEQLSDSLGQRYQVTVGGFYNDGDLIPVEGVDTGLLTNHVEDDVLTWLVPPTFGESTALVAPGGLTNGLDEEDDETLRQRVLTRLGNPPGGGNASQVAQLATDSTSRVQAGFVYPAYRGPATVGVAVVGYASTRNRNRDIDATTLTTVVAPYIIGNLPEHIGCDVTTVTNVPADLAIGLNIPSAPTASPPGAGGGWVDGSPWPQIDTANSIRFASVGTVTNSTSFTVVAKSATSPVAGASKICWLSYSGSQAWTLYTATVLTSTESPSGTYTITIDAPFPGIAAGDYVFPASVNAQLYVDATLAAFAAMGPGEKRSPVLAREFRRPLPGTQWPNTLGAHILRRISDVGEEVEDVQFYSRRPDSNLNYSNENANGSVGVPSVLTDPVRIFVPRRIGFYQLT